MILYQIFISILIILIPINILILLNISNKQDNYTLFDISLIISLLLLYITKKESLYIYLSFIQIPYITSRIYKRKNLSIIISFITVLIYKQVFQINILILIMEYLIYFLAPTKKLKYLVLIGTIINYYTCFKFNITKILLIIVLYFIILNILKIYQKQIKELKNYNEILNILTKEKNKNISISKLAHEIKNPLAVCNGYIEMINHDDKENTKKYLSIVKNELERSITIINDYNNYGKLTNLNLEEIDLIYLFEDINNLLDPLFKSNNAKIIFENKSEIYLNADYNRLKQVFINILKNTIEAKKEYENLLVKIKIKNKDNNIQITIEDNGIGMSKEMLNHLFEIFYTTKQTGTGLGIVYSKEVIELHGGTIKYTSKENKGTKVFINIPKVQQT